MVVEQDGMQTQYCIRTNFEQSGQCEFNINLTKTFCLNVLAKEKENVNVDGHMKKRRVHRSIVILQVHFKVRSKHELCSLDAARDLQHLIICRHRFSTWPLTSDYK